MKKKSFFLTAFIALSLTSCSNDDFFFDDHKPQKPIIETNSLSSGAIIGGDGINGNTIELLYSHPPTYSGHWNIYLQYQFGSTWRNYDPSGNNNPSIIQSGYGKLNYFIRFDGRYLPQLTNTIKIGIEQFSPTKLPTIWSDAYQMKSYNQNGFDPGPNFEGCGSSRIEIVGNFNPPAAAHTAETTISVKNNWEGPAVSKKFDFGMKYFKTTVGVKSGQSYSISYTIRYYDTDHREVYPSKEGSTNVCAYSSFNTAYLN